MRGANGFTFVRSSDFLKKYNVGSWSALRKTLTKPGIYLVCIFAAYRINAGVK